MDEVQARGLRTLGWFVVRARRVEEHSLLTDTDELVRWASATGRIARVEDGPDMVRWVLPPEEAMDSLAARCRPLVLQRDPVYWGKVLKAIGYYLRDDEDQLRAPFDAFRAKWRVLDQSAPGFLAFQVRSQGPDGVAGELVDDKTLAYAWLYSDLVHADSDEEPGELDRYSINDRYRAGAILIANVAMLAVATLNLLRALVKRGTIPLSEEPFTRPVKADPDRMLPMAGMASLPVGATVEELEALLDSGVPAEDDPTGDTVSV